MKKLFLIGAVLALVISIGIPNMPIPASLQSPLIMAQLDNEIKPPAPLPRSTQVKEKKEANFDSHKVKSALSMILMVSLAGGGGES